MPKKKTILDPIKCAVCETEFTPKTKKVRTCSKSCGCKLGNTKEAREKGRQTRLERYGDPNFNNREKVRKTIQAKYGEQYINTSQVPHIKAKIVKTYTENNGGMGMASKKVAKKVLEATKENLGIDDDSITNVGQIEAVKEKIKETTEERWGGIGFASEELAKKSMDTFKETYGEDFRNSEYLSKVRAEGYMRKYGKRTPMEVPEIKEKAIRNYKEKHGGMGQARTAVKEEREEKLKRFKEVYEKEKKPTVTKLAEIMGVSISTISVWAKELDLELTTGNKLNESWQLLIKKETGIEFKFEGKIYGDNRKADLYNDEFKLAIEINPTITHSTQPTPFHGKKVPVKYHQERAIAAEENGWHLIQVFDWDKKENIVKLIKSLCNIEQTKIYARKCELREIPSKYANEFIQKNHRQGANLSSNIAFGLFYDDVLVQVMTFSKERFTREKQEKSYELIRLCSKEGYVVVGGSNRLFKAFVNSDYQPNKIKTFSDYSKGQGKIYEKIGMKFVGLANLNGLYANIDTGEAYKVTACTSKFKKEYEKLRMTQQQYMNSKRFYRINDAGNKIFEWKRNEN